MLVKWGGGGGEVKRKKGRRGVGANGVSEISVVLYDLLTCSVLRLLSVSQQFDFPFTPSLQSLQNM